MGRGKLDNVMTVLFILGLVVAPIIGGAGVFVWQVVEWLSTGQWASASMLDLLISTLGMISWAENPTSWIGLWKLLGWLPLSVCGILFGGTMLVGHAFE